MATSHRSHTMHWFQLSRSMTLLQGKAPLSRMLVRVSHQLHTPIPHRPCTNRSASVVTAGPATWRVLSGRSSHLSTPPATPAGRSSRLSPPPAAHAASSISTPVVAPEGAGTSKKPVPVDYTTLSACVQDLQSWVPAKLEQVVMPDRVSLALRLRTLSGAGWLHVSWHPVAGRVSLGSQPPLRGHASEGYSLVEQLVSQLQGKVLVAVELPQVWERVVCLRFGHRPGEDPTHSLYCEIMARYSNAVLTDATGVILACAYQVGSAMSSLRNVQVGRTYALPPVTQGVPPDTHTTWQDWQVTVIKAAALGRSETTPPRPPTNQQRSSSSSAPAQQGTETADPSTHKAAGHREGAAGASGHGSLAEGLVRAYHGVSPALVQDLCAAAGVSAGAAVVSVTDSQWQALYMQWQDWLHRVHNGQFSPCSDRGLTRYSMLGSLPVEHTSVCELVEQYYSTIQMSENHVTQHRRLVSVVTAAAKKVRGKVAAFEKQLADADKADGVQRTADMITANIYRIPAGASEVVVEDWDTGAPVTLTLDSTKPAVQTAEALYKKARKLRRVFDAVDPLLQAARQEVEYLAEVENSLSQLSRFASPEDTAALQEVQDELVAGGYMKAPADAALQAKAAAKASKAAKRAAKGKGAATAPEAGAGAGFRVFTSPGGYQVLVGRNNKQNDELSLRVTKDSDLWMHLRGRPGSHTVLRVPSGKPTPTLDSDDVQFAADLAAYFSKGRDDGKCDVIVAPGAALKKPKGAKPGQVLVTKEVGNVVARPGNSAAANEAALAGTKATL